MLHSDLTRFKSLGLALFLLSTLSFGSPSEVTFQGTDKGRTCFLYVHTENPYGTGGEAAAGAQPYRVVVSTSYEHNGQGLGEVTLQFAPDGGGKLLKWANPYTQELLVVQLKQPQATLQDPNAFRVKWFHGDHIHDNVCSNLTKVN